MNWFKDKIELTPEEEAKIVRVRRIAELEGLIHANTAKRAEVKAESLKLKQELDALLGA